ncbi:MAG: transketolase [Thermodesulfobacteriota bacterium]
MDERSRHLRRLIVETLGKAGRGHPASAFSVVDILRALYDHVLRVDPAAPWKPERDRCILSKGHGCLALYAVLADKGFFPAERLCGFCGFDSRLGGHPERASVPGVEATTGSLGHGLSLGVGMALAARHDRRDSRVFVVLGDGECNEGSIWEAALSAAKHRLDNLAAVVDYNKQQSYASTTEVLDLEPFADKWRAFGFAVAEVDGHDVAALTEAFTRLPQEPGRPTAVICHTVKGKGVSFMERDLSWHHKSKVLEQDVERLLAELA